MREKSVFFLNLLMGSGIGDIIFMWIITKEDKDTEIIKYFEYNTICSWFIASDKELLYIKRVWNMKGPKIVEMFNKTLQNWYVQKWILNSLSKPIPSQFSSSQETPLPFSSSALSPIPGPVSLALNSCPFPLGFKQTVYLPQYPVQIPPCFPKSSWSLQVRALSLSHLLSAHSNHHQCDPWA